MASARNPKSEFWKIFSEVYAHALKRNTWTGQIFPCNSPFIDTPWDTGKPVSVGELLNRLEDAIDYICPLSDSQLSRKLDSFFHKGISFSPVEEYLEGLTRKFSHYVLTEGKGVYGDLTETEWDEWGTLAKTWFGTDDPMAQVKLEKMAIGAVARAMQPGCKMDTALVLKGKTGIGKTSFFAALFGEHFRTLHSHSSTLEQQRILQTAWGCEYGEIESTFAKKDISAMKAFLTETHDSYRDLYKELGEPKPRHCVFLGTTNEGTFLNDPTGSRRFWVIDLGDHKIPIDHVQANRDRFWAMALRLYRDDRPWWLTDLEFAASEQQNQAFQIEDNLAELIRPVLHRLENPTETTHEDGKRVTKAVPRYIAITANEVALGIVGVARDSLNSKSKAIAAAMSALGYERRKIKRNGTSSYFYVKPEAPTSEVYPVDFAEVTEATSAVRR